MLSEHTRSCMMQHAPNPEVNVRATSAYTREDDIHVNKHGETHRNRHFQYPAKYYLRRRLEDEQVGPGPHV